MRHDIPLALLAATVLAATLAGCESAATATATWDAAVDTLPEGPVRVVNTPPAGGIVPDRVIREELRIGSLDGEGATAFSDIRGLQPLSDGRIAVLDAQTQELRIFGPDGSHLVTFGGRGNGPGEFEAAYGLMRDGQDRLWIPDHRNARMSVVDPDDGFLRSHPLTILSRGFIWRGVMASDGRILKPSITLAPRANVFRVWDREMNLIDSLPAPPGPDVPQDDPPSAFTWGSREGGAFGYYGVPFFPSSQQVLDPRGFSWTTAYGDPSYRIELSELGGDTLRVLETRRPTVPVTQAERDSVIEVVREALRDRGGADQDWSKIPAVKPAVLGMFLSEEGDLWVRAASPDERITYDVYDRDGRHRSTAVTDLDLLPYLAPVVRGDVVWGVVTDELDVPYVVRGRLEPYAEAGG